MIKALVLVGVGVGEERRRLLLGNRLSSHAFPRKKTATSLSGYRDLYPFHIEPLSNSVNESLRGFYASLLLISHLEIVKLPGICNM